MKKRSIPLLFLKANALLLAGVGVNWLLGTFGNVTAFYEWLALIGLVVVNGVLVYVLYNERKDKKE